MQRARGNGWKVGGRRFFLAALFWMISIVRMELLLAGLTMDDGLEETVSSSEASFAPTDSFLHDVHETMVLPRRDGDRVRGKDPT